MSNFKCGDIVEGEITGITKYGIFVRLEDNYNGLIHISEISNEFIDDINKMYFIGNIISVKVLDIDEDKLHVKLSIKKVNVTPKTKIKKIKESGTGFKPLENNLSSWIEKKSEELNKIEKKK